MNLMVVCEWEIYFVVHFILLAASEDRRVFENFSVVSDILGFLSVQIMKYYTMNFTSPRKF
jgi:hypothetical protein